MKLVACYEHNDNTPARFSILDWIVSPYRIAFILCLLVSPSNSFGISILVFQGVLNVFQCSKEWMISKFFQLLSPNIEAFGQFSLKLFFSPILGVIHVTRCRSQYSFEIFDCAHISSLERIVHVRSCQILQLSPKELLDKTIEFVRSASPTSRQDKIFGRPLSYLAVQLIERI